MIVLDRWASAFWFSLLYLFILPSLLWLAAHPFVIVWRLFLEASILADLPMLTRNEMTLYFALYFSLLLGILHWCCRII